MQRKTPRRMDAGAYNWLVKTARKNYWRVASWYDLSDLIQDGVMCYYVVRQRYPTASARKHIMRLFQVTYINHVHALSNKKRQACAEVAMDDPAIEIERFADEDADLDMYLAEAPAEVSTVIRALMAKSEELRAPYRRSGKRATTNQRFCRIVGANANTRDLHALVRTYLRSGELIDPRILRGLWIWDEEPLICSL
jgi:hypothetical protein